MAKVILIVETTRSGLRSREAVTCGIPWARGSLKDSNLLALFDCKGQAVPLQTRILDYWPDQSVRWILLDWQATADLSAQYELRNTQRAEQFTDPSFQIKVIKNQDQLQIDTGAAQFVLARESSFQSFPFQSIKRSDGEAIDPKRTRLVVQDDAGKTYFPLLRRVQLQELGPLRASVFFQGFLHSEDQATSSEGLLDIFAYLHFFAGSSTVRFHVTLRNPRKAEHPGGFWDLGNGGSIFLRDVSFTAALPPDSTVSVVRYSAEAGDKLGQCQSPFELYQDSSGGDNWRSSNHLNRHHVIPNTFQGYRLCAGNQQSSGKRATPIVSLKCGSREVTVATNYFWQNFPKAIDVSSNELTFRLFPRQYADVHEIQGGEQKTHTFHIAFGPDEVTEVPLDWARSPLLACATPEWYSASGVLPYLTPRSTDAHSKYLQLVDAAIEGEDTFEHKREVIDQFGWRHFGDIYGDHEAVFHKGLTPLVSHYNNQYDAIAGLGFQFFRSGDRRWWHAMDELASHVIDIDIYHTHRDKAGYNHGLFWHTVHYVDADTGTHRTYPRSSRAHGVNGGGPATEQNYTTGLMLHYFLTGDPWSRDTALGLARWVIDMDDGNKTVFRWLARGFTGSASSSRTPYYHGPGRGAANSIAALLDGHRLSGDRAYLEKAEQLIRRCIHPADDIAARNLLDAENRWFYTMFLQSLGRYLDYKIELGEIDRMYAYGRACLLHYVNWMAVNEYPYLSKPERLEFPTETWAAQDMRKSEIFKLAIKHSTGKERERLRERSDFFFHYTTTALADMKTRTLCRPVVLLLSYGFMHNFFQQNPEVTAPQGPAVADYGKPETFVPQRVRAKKRFLALAAGGTLVFLVLAGFAIRVWFLS